jgi:uncharacterized protein (DUF302 family)
MVSYVSTPVGFEVRVDLSFEQAIARVTDALREEGFGVLTTIDVRKTLAEKIGTDFRDYVILGACNPRLAYRALSTRADAGLLLPCNVTVEREVDGRVLVRIADPQTMLGAGGLAHEAELADVAREARLRLHAVARSVAGEHGEA